MSFLSCVLLLGMCFGEVQVDHVIDASQTHSKFSAKIPPVLMVKSGAVIQVETKEATDGQFTPQSTADAVRQIDLARVHPLTGPVYVEGAEPGDVLAMKLLEIELSDWGWTAIVPGLGFLGDEFKGPNLKHFQLDKEARTTRFSKDIVLPLHPFPGVIGVAPASDEMLSTIPPRANGGNLDDPHLVAGTTVYLPVFVKGGLLSVGDPHATQGLGEVCGSAIESPLTITYQVTLIKNQPRITEVQYENDEVYATTGFAPTIDEAARKATRFMVDYLEQVKGLSRVDAYMLCSLAGDLHIAETVDIPNMLVTMHLPKKIFDSP